MAENNAQLRRHSPDVVANDLRRLLDNPEVQEGFERMESELVNQLADAQHDGSNEFQNMQDEYVRTLRTIRRLKKAMWMPTQMNDLREHGFQSRAPVEDVVDGS